MRETHLERLSEIEIDLNNNLYLHYSTYHHDLFDQLGRYAKGRTLDIGCGNMPYKKVLGPLITEYIGCDIVQSSTACVDILCPANDIPVGDSSFDTVISTQTIEHLEDHQGMVNEAYRVLDNSGYFIISGPMYWPLHEEPYDFFRFTKHGLRYILEKAGFEIVTISSNGGKWAVAGQALIHALYPTVNNIRGFKGKIIRMIAKGFGGVKTINRLFSYLDHKVPDYTNTMNYVIVARKNQHLVNSAARNHHHAL
ncbi:class I SAM-dependent methyltransferase [Mucilaginibacter sabulilitoris]|uniref:Class I SAM-dependent methyltransferase n=1 Tax=Mucilaginibacter sabulilitoris TaxID=1173583 RepID=A0ABZ0TFV2_9SPHI|nr:class I SAM-dependent methyltransferase [Mucilaginibacter sabulilitoris]WPU91644.1 class I SAM-dependent methyltransferase [Mucilaginibacter sabulilitoris]